MPLTKKGEEIERAMEKEYGPKKGESVFYASANKGTISGVHSDAAGAVLIGEGEKMEAKVNPPVKVVEMGEEESPEHLPQQITLAEMQARNDKMWKQQDAAPPPPPAPAPAPRPASPSVQVYNGGNYRR